MGNVIGHRYVIQSHYLKATYVGALRETEISVLEVRKEKEQENQRSKGEHYADT